MSPLRRRVATGLTGLLVMAGVGLAGPLAGASAANLITNGSFEQPDIATGSFAVFANGLVPGWTHEPAPHAVSSSGLEIQDHAAGAPDPSAGDQFTELDSNGPSNIYQDVATNPGSTYRLSFLYSARPGTAADQNHFRASAGPESAEIGPLTSTSVNVWVAHTLDFVATGTSSRIAFLDLGPEEPSGGLGAYVDLVSVDFVNTPPDCSAVAASPTTLWPPNHKLHTITLSGATDPDGPVTLAVTGVTQDEPTGGAPDAAAGAERRSGPAPRRARRRWGRARVPDRLHRDRCGRRHLLGHCECLGRARHERRARGGLRRQLRLLRSVAARKCQGAWPPGTSAAARPPA